MLQKKSFAQCSMMTNLKEHVLTGNIPGNNFVACMGVAKQYSRFPGVFVGGKQLRAINLFHPHAGVAAQ